MYGLYQIVLFTIKDILYTLKSPFFLLILGIIYFQYRKIGEMEKEILGSRKNSLIKVFTSTIFGIFGGTIASIIFIYLGIVINPKDFIYILVAAITLSLINPRYMCFSYGGSIISLMNLIFGFPKIDVSSVMSVVAVLHLVESILVLLDGNRNRVPVFMEEGTRVIGAFNMNRFWPIPFVIFIGNDFIFPVTLIAILGYSDYAISTYPNGKTKKTSFTLFLYSLILLFLSKTPSFLYFSPIFGLVGHEFIILRNKKKEKSGIPLFTPSIKGVKVLEVLPNGIGSKLGIKTGDILLTINGIKIRDKKDIEDILFMKPDKLRLEFYNRNKGLTIKTYEGNNKEYKSLGLVIVPKIPEFAIIIQEKNSWRKRILNKAKRTN